MGIKSALKKTIGNERLSSIKGKVYHYGSSINLSMHNKSKLEYNENKIQLKTILTEDNHHVFRGYYDIDYLNGDGNRFLCHRLPINAENNKKTKCEIGYYLLDTGTFNKIAETSAWSWQQGSRLRWIDQDHLIFNDVQDDNYCARIFDVTTGLQSGFINYPLYDFASDFRYGLTLNFSRLQRLRPGYGYDFFSDDSEGINAPDDDGIFLIDLETGENRLMYSLSKMAWADELNEDYIHYVNHISIAPDGEHFIFFHIYLKPNEHSWRTVLYVSDILGNKLVTLEKEDRVSHYCWIDNVHIIVTCRKDNNEEYYCIYDINTGKKTLIDIPELHVDGHPCKASYDNLFITDTYPLDNSIQKIYRFHVSDSNTETLASIYHDYRLRGEKRCDLHPSISKDYSLLSVDSTFQNERRNVIIFDLGSEE